MNKIPVQHVDLRLIGKQLEEYLGNELRKAKLERQELDQKWTIWMKQYDGRLERSDRPKSWMSNIDIQTTRQAIQALVSRLVNTVQGTDKIFSTAPNIPNMYDYAVAIEDFLDYAFDQIDADQFMRDMALNSAIYGLSIIKVVYTMRQRVVKEWVEVPVEMQTELSPEVIGPQQPMQSQLVEVPRVYEEKNGCYPEVLNPSDVFFRYCVSDPDFLPWISHRTYVTKYDLALMTSDGELPEGVLQVFQPVGSVDEFTKAREKLSGIDYKDERYEIHEFWLKFDVDGDGIREDIIVVFDATSGKIGSCIYNYLHDYKFPFVFYFWEKKPGTLESNSACQILEPLHRMITAGTNQQLDAATLAIRGFLVLTTDQRFADLWKDGDIDMGDVVVTNALPRESSEIFQFAQEMTNMAQLVAQARQDVNLTIGLNLYNYGVEQVERPTAAGQSMIIEEGKQPLYERLRIFRAALRKVAIMLLARYKQFHQNRVDYYVPVPGNPMQTMEFMPGLTENQVFIDVQATTAQMNEQVRRQELIGLEQEMTKAYTQIMGMLQSATQMQMVGSPYGAVGVGYAQSYQNMVYRILKEFKVPYPEQILPPIDMLTLMAQQYNVIIQQLNAQVSQLEQELELQKKVQQVKVDLARAGREAKKESDND